MCGSTDERGRGSIDGDLDGRCWIDGEDLNGCKGMDGEFFDELAPCSCCSGGRGWVGGDCLGDFLCSTKGDSFGGWRDTDSKTSGLADG